MSASDGQSRRNYSIVCVDEYRIGREEERRDRGREGPRKEDEVSNHGSKVEDCRHNQRPARASTPSAQSNFAQPRPAQHSPARFVPP
ncbi:hypothetical protein E2C01_030458 [Portunus trituberculatus]|uniref:Uncharacterized protein n=1 Tax=Portunus trituberculatus TaxID=210409 RepID=A0A5B7EUA8_PORTR|nr:hypothetical protein [Portunus trituberculatus]